MITNDVDPPAGRHRSQSDPAQSSDKELAGREFESSMTVEQGPADDEPTEAPPKPGDPDRKIGKEPTPGEPRPKIGNPPPKIGKSPPEVDDPPRKVSNPPPPPPPPSESEPPSRSSLVHS